MTLVPWYVVAGCGLLVLGGVVATVVWYVKRGQAPKQRIGWLETGPAPEGWHGRLESEKMIFTEQHPAVFAPERRSSMLRKFFCLSVLLPLFASATPLLPVKSPNRYYTMTYTFSTTSSITAGLVGVLPQSGMVLKDVIMWQSAAGDGTSWVATPKRSAVAMVSTAGGFTAAAGTTKTINTANSPLMKFADVTGGTRPVIQGPTFASQTYQAGTVVAGNTVTIGGVVYTAAASGNGTTTYTTGGATAATTATNLAAAINRNPLSVVTAQVSTDTVTVYARQPGTAGNAITSVASANYTVGGATLANGYDYKSSGGSPITVDVTLTGSYTAPVTGGIILLFDSAQ